MVFQRNPQKIVKAIGMKRLLFVGLSAIAVGTAVIAIAFAFTLSLEPLIVVGLLTISLGIVILGLGNLLNSLDEGTSNRQRPEVLSEDVILEVWKRHVGSRPDGRCFANDDHDIGIVQFEIGRMQDGPGREADTIGNLRPICGQCSENMGTHSMRNIAGVIEG